MEFLRKGWGHERSGSRKLRPHLRVVEMSASGAVEPGPPGVAAAPSPTTALAPAPGRLFRPISAEDEEQQPTEIESLCMNCYRNVRQGTPRRAAGGLDEAVSGGRLASPLGGPSRVPGGEARPGGVRRGTGVSLVLDFAPFRFPRA